MASQEVRLRKKENVYDRIGIRLINAAANLLMMSYVVVDSQKVAKNIARSEQEIEVLGKEAIAQIEKRATEIEQAVSLVRDSVRALKEGQAAQVENRQAIEALAGHLAEMDIEAAHSDIAGLATILGHQNYKHLLMADVELWAWMLKVVDGPVFAEAVKRQDAKRQNELMAGMIANE